MEDANLRKCYDYVAKKNEELELGLSDGEILETAEKYDEELATKYRDQYVLNGFIENDVLLLKVVTGVIEDALYEQEDKMLDYETQYKTNAERAINARGGYGYNDSYDDHGLDEEELGIDDNEPGSFGR